MLVKVKGWILYKNSTADLKTKSYEIKSLLKVAPDLDIDIKLINPIDIDLIITSEDNKSILYKNKVQPLPDFVISRFGASTTYFTLSLLRHLERLNVCIFNSANSIEVVKDKLHTQQVLANYNLPVPQTMLVKYPVNSSLVERVFGFPLVVKTISGTQGNGVYLCTDKNNFEDLIQFINSTDTKTNIILQKYIKTSHGKDLRVFVIGGRVVACIQRKAKNDGFKANFSRGGEVVQYEITPEIEWIATETAKILNLDIAGIDLLFNDDHFLICEANSSPGFKGIEKCCDISIAEEIYKYAKLRLCKL
ncbi:RimK family alpha-L-glutamate ligase [bacterium]|nr:RimK family alpha-L-glutamate ligase [bacterium]MBT4551898.1 RimK family alpha-L-glutamate ligase [bacterium]MBT5988819.1 RimK family alpha-L-glutamate ligase [bacterium]